MQNFKIFQASLSKNIASFECRFIVRTFFNASLSFFAVGALLCFLLIWDSAVSFLKNETFLFINGIAAIVLFIWFIISRMKYQMNPLAADSTLITKNYALMISSKICIFLMMFAFAPFPEATFQLQHKLALVATIFGFAFLIYLIPATVGLYIKKHSTIIKLSKFLIICTFINFMFLFMMLGSLLLFGVFSDLTYFATSFLIGVVILCLPIITFYKLKVIVPLIDQNNEVAIKQWENYFVLEILFQLLEIAYYLLILVWRFARRFYT